MLLDTNGAAVASFQHLLGFDPLRTAVRKRPDEYPDCTVHPALGLGSDPSFTWRPSGCDGTDCAAVFAVVFSLAGPVLLPDAEIYRCVVRIAGDAPPATYPLVVSGVVMSDPDGVAIAGAAGVDGAVIVEPPPAAEAVVIPVGAFPAGIAVGAPLP